MVAQPLFLILSTLFSQSTRPVAPAIHRVAAKGDSAALRKLLSAGAQVNAKDTYGAGPLRRGCQGPGDGLGGHGRVLARIPLYLQGLPTLGGLPVAVRQHGYTVGDLDDINDARDRSGRAVIQ